MREVPSARSVPPAWSIASQFYAKAQADARFLRGSFTVVASAIVTNGSFGSATATCPAGSQVVGGGVEPNNVLTMILSASYPLVDGTALISLTDGQHGPATAWRAFVDNTSSASRTDQGHGSLRADRLSVIWRDDTRRY